MVPLAALMIGLASSAALSTEPTPPPKPPESAPVGKPAIVSAEPAMTTATYGDRLLRCQRPAEGDSAAKICEVVQTIRVQGQQAPIALFGIGRQGNKTLHATVARYDKIAFAEGGAGSADGSRDPRSQLDANRARRMLRRRRLAR